MQPWLTCSYYSSLLFSKGESGAVSPSPSTTAEAGKPGNSRLSKRRECHLVATRRGTRAQALCPSISQLHTQTKTNPPHMSIQATAVHTWRFAAEAAMDYLYLRCHEHCWTMQPRRAGHWPLLLPQHFSGDPSGPGGSCHSWLHTGGSRAPWESSPSWTGVHRGWCHQRPGVTLGVEGTARLLMRCHSARRCHTRLLNS